MIDRTQGYTFRRPPTAQLTDTESYPHHTASGEKGDLNIKALLRGVWMRSLIGLILIALLSTTTYFIISSLLKLNEKSGTIVNISGRQRMLSQRGALFALQVATNPDPEKRAAAAKTLTAVADLMERSHNGLINGSDELGLPDKRSPAMTAMYFEAPDALDEQVRQYIASIRSLLADAERGEANLANEHLQSILVQAPTRLLQTLNKAVLQYEQEASDELQTALRYEKIVYVVTLLTLLLEALLIYRPLVNRVKNTTNDFLRQLQFSDSVVNTSQALIIGLDQAAQVRLFNAHSEQLTGWRAEDVIGQNFLTTFIPADERETLSDVHNRLFAGESAQKLETPLRTKSDGQLMIEWSYTLLIDPETSKPVLLLATGVDITQRKKDEESLRKAWGETEALSSRLQEEVSHAAILQQALLPPPAFKLPGIQGLARLTTSTEVGGDYYDYYDVGGHHSVFLVGDVSGHGVASGTLVSAAKMAVHQLNNLKETDPAAILEHINESLLTASHESMFMTMICFSLDSRSGVARVANAGHVFPYIWIADEGEWCMIESEGVPLGKVINPGYEAITFDLELGDKLFLYTDGIIEEASPQGEQFGFERLEELLYNTAALPIEAAHVALFSELEAHCEKPIFSDDVTLMLVEHTERTAAGASSPEAVQPIPAAVQFKAAALLNGDTHIERHLSRQYTVVSYAQNELAPLLPSLCQQGIRRVLPDDQPILQAIGWENLLQQHRLIQADDVTQWIPEPTLSKRWDFNHSDDKSSVMHELGALLADQPALPDTLQDIVLLLADELIENSLYGAPRDRSNQALFSKGDSRTVATFEGVRLDLHQDAAHLSLSMTDHWGSFTPATFLNRLYLNSSEQGGMEAGVGGTGLYLMWRVSDYLQIRVLPGVKTQVTLLWDLSHEPDESDSGFQFLYHSEINEVIQSPTQVPDEVAA